MDAARRQLVEQLDRIASAARRIAMTRRGAAETDLVIGAILSRPESAQLSDPTAFVRFLRDCFRPLSFSVREVRRDDARLDLPALRFQTLLDQLAAGAEPIDQRDAVRIGRIADELVESRVPFERPDWAADVGLHARVASSFGRKGRLLASVVRLMRARRVVEIGTAYGMSALFIAAAMDDDGRIVTLERSEPQLGIATRLLEREHPGRAVVIGGIAMEHQQPVREAMSSADLLFHDGEHSRRAYVEDFTAFEPLLIPGAVVLYDDLRWSRAGAGPAPDTYAGWREVAAHPRVRRAVEVDRELGLLLLR